MKSRANADPRHDSHLAEPSGRSVPVAAGVPQERPRISQPRSAPRGCGRAAGRSEFCATEVGQAADLFGRCATGSFLSQRAGADSLESRSGAWERVRRVGAGAGRRRWFAFPAARVYHARWEAKAEFRLIASTDGREGLVKPDPPAAGAGSLSRGKIRPLRIVVELDHGRKMLTRNRPFLRCGTDA